MKSSFTPNDLILLAYNETEKPDQVNLYQEMQTDRCLREEFKSILGDKYHIDSSAVSPDKRIMSNLMSYSKALFVAKTKAGYFNLLMN